MSTMTNAEKIAYFKSLSQQGKAAAPSENEAGVETPQAPATVSSLEQHRGGGTAGTEGAANKTALDELKESGQKASKEAKEQSARDEIDRLVGQFTVFKDQRGEFYAVTKNGSRTDVVAVQDDQFTRELRVRLFKDTGRAPSDTQLKLIIDTLIVHNGDHFQHLYKRIARDQGDILLDLGDEAGQAVRISADGWQLDSAHECLFRRSKGYGEIGVPEHIESAPDALRALEPLLTRIPKERQVHLIAALVTTLISEADYPIILLVGPEGSAKTSVAHSLAKVIDPPLGLPPTVNLKEAADVVAGVQDRHIAIIDNAPHRMGADIENALCVVSTGGELQSRRFHTNHDVISAELHSPLIVTAIQRPFRQRDTLNRTLTFNFDALQGGFRRREDVGNDIDQHINAIRGGLLYFASAYLRDRDAITEAVPHRMVDWAVAGEIIARELKAQPGEFFKSIKIMQRGDAQDYLEGDYTGISVIKTLRKWGDEATTADKLPPYKKWSSGPGWAAIHRSDGMIEIVTKASTLQQQGALMSMQGGGSMGRDEHFPKNGRDMTSALKRLEGVFGRAGIQCKLEGGNKRNYWAFTCKPEALAAEAFD